jgi:hypothetical protein
MIQWLRQRREVYSGIPNRSTASEVSPSCAIFSSSVICLTKSCARWSKESSVFFVGWAGVLGGTESGRSVEDERSKEKDLS